MAYKGFKSFQLKIMFLGKRDLHGSQLKEIV